MGVGQVFSPGIPGVLVHIRAVIMRREACVMLDLGTLGSPVSVALGSDIGRADTKKMEGVHFKLFYRTTYI